MRDYTAGILQGTYSVHWSAHLSMYLQYLVELCIMPCTGGNVFVQRQEEEEEEEEVREGVFG